MLSAWQGSVIKFLQVSVSDRTADIVDVIYVNYVNM
jgi:hypothetical protein